MIPDFWRKFVDENDLIGKEIEVSDEADMSSLGADLKIMTWEQAKSESTEWHPGIEAAKSGYFPVAMCLEGSGDYYYINAKLENGPLFRIYHDSVAGEELEESGVEMVLESYAQLLSQ